MKRDVTPDGNFVFLSNDKMSGNGGLLNGPFKTRHESARNEHGEERSGLAIIASCCSRPIGKLRLNIRRER